MTDTFDMAAMLADREAGTPGPWIIYKSREQYIVSIGPCSPEEHAGAAWLDVTEIDARRISRVPAMEAEIIRLTEKLAAAHHSLVVWDMAHRTGKMGPLVHAFETGMAVLDAIRAMKEPDHD